MNPFVSPGPASNSDSQPEMDVVDLLAGLNGDASLALANRTRHAVREAALSIQQRRLRHRRNVGLALSAIIGMLLVLGPAIWNGLEEIWGGEEHMADLPAQVSIFLLLLGPAIFAALIAVWKQQRDLQLHRRGF